MTVLKKLVRLIPALCLLFILVYRVDYRLEAPGDLEALEGFITFENDAASPADLNAIYIMSFNRPTAFQWLIAQLMPSIDVTPLTAAQQSVTNTDRFESGQVARNSAIDKAIITAYDALGLTVTYDTQILVYLIYDYAKASGLQIGDVIRSVNGNPDVYDGLAQSECGEEAIIEVMRDQTPLTVRLLKHAGHACTFGISLSTFYAIEQLPLRYDTADTIVGGPSAGLMQTLYIYDSLTDVTGLSGYKIAGTGTIALDGKIGSVGAIKQKVYTAQQARVDVLFMPAGANYNAALEVYETLSQPRFDLVEVAYFSDVIAYLAALK